jgi:hypothetical protein
MIVETTRCKDLATVGRDLFAQVRMAAFNASAARLLRLLPRQATEPGFCALYQFDFGSDQLVAAIRQRRVIGRNCPHLREKMGELLGLMTG